MVDVAKHVRIFDTQPSDDLVDKRTIVISALAEKFLKYKSYQEHFGLINDLVKAVEHDSFALLDKRTSEVEAAIKAQSSAFTRDGQALQIITCLMLALLKTIDEAPATPAGWSSPEIFAVLLWLGLSLQKPRAEARIEALRSELLIKAKELVTKTSETARNRQTVPDPTTKLTELTDAAKVAEAISKSALKSIEVLRQNAALDREELDLLWWTLGEWSSVQGQRFAALPMHTAAVTAGIEGAALLRRLPSIAHKQLILKHVDDGDAQTLTNLIETLGERKDALRLAIPQSEYAKAYPSVFALTAGILGEVANTQAVGVREWGARAIVEAVVLRFSQNVPVV